MATQADFGWREGMRALGSYRDGDLGLSFIYAPTGGDDPRVPGSPPAPAGSLWAWIVAPPAYTLVTMVRAYEPAQVPNFPTRGAVRSGDTCNFPSVEASALVAAGIATLA